MRILHINDLRGAAGGTETYLTRLFGALKAEGHWVGLIYWRSERESSWQDPADCFAVDFRQPLPRLVAEILGIVQRVRPEILQINNLGAAVRIFPHLRPLYDEVPLVWFLHGIGFQCPGGEKYYHRTHEVCRIRSGLACLWHTFYHSCNSWRPARIWNSMWRCAEAKKYASVMAGILVASRYVKTCAVQNGFPEQLITVLPYFVEPAAEAPDPKRKQILFAGRIVKSKGLEQLLQALDLVLAKDGPVGRSTSLVVAGDGPDRARCEALCRQMGLADRVRFLGWCDAEVLAENYREASVVVMPSLGAEGFGLSGVEAMSHGRPVVAFDVGGISDWLENGVTGFLVKPFDVLQMAGHIGYVLRHPAEAREMGRRGRRKVEQEFGKDRHIERLLEVYRGAVDGRSRYRASAD